MAGVVGQEADGREPDGAEAVGQGEPIMGLVWSRSSGCWAGRHQIRG